MKISANKARDRVFSAWMVGLIVVLAILAAATIGGSLKEPADSNDAAWGWVLGALLPTAGVLLGTYKQGAGAGRQRTVPRVLAGWVLALVTLYLLVVAAFLLWALREVEIIASLAFAAKFTTVLHGLVGAAVGTLLWGGEDAAETKAESRGGA